MVVDIGVDTDIGPMRVLIGVHASSVNLQGGAHCRAGVSWATGWLTVNIPTGSADSGGQDRRLLPGVI